MLSVDETWTGESEIGSLTIHFLVIDSVSSAILWGFSSGGWSGRGCGGIMRFWWNSTVHGDCGDAQTHIRSSFLKSFIH